MTVHAYCPTRRYALEYARLMADYGGTLCESLAAAWAAGETMPSVSRKYRIGRWSLMDACKTCGIVPPDGRRV